MARLGDVAQILRGVTFKPDQLVDESDQDAVVCLRTKNVQVELDWTDLLFIPRSLVPKDRQYVRTGDIIVSSANSWNQVGKCAWVSSVERPTTFGGFISNLRVQSDEVDARYLYWWFSSPRTQTMVRSFGQQTTNISNLNVSRTLDLDVPLPPLPEQRRIASILDDVDALRSARRTAIARNRTVMAEALSSIAKYSDLLDLGDLVQEFRYGTSAKSGPTGLPVLRIPNVSRRILDLSDLKFVELSQAEVDRLELRVGDLLIVRSNGNPDLVGATALFDVDGLQPFVYASYLIRARPKGTVDPTYLVSYLTSQAGRAALRAGARTSAGQYNINTKALAAMKVPVPDLSVQQDFARKVQRLQETTTLMTAHLAKLDELIASLQHRAFRGEL